MPALVQQATAVDGTGADTSFVITLGSASTNGNFLVLSYGATPQNDVTGVSGGGVTWVEATGAKNVTGNRSHQLWYGLNVTGGGTAITVTLAGSIGAGNAVAGNISEWSGVATTAALDQTANAGDGSGTSTAPVTGTTPATTQASELLIAGMHKDDTAVPSAGPTNGFTALTRVTSGALGSIEPAYNVVSATGTYSTGWTIAAGKWVAGIGTFKAAAAGPSTAQVMPAMIELGESGGVIGRMDV